MTMSLMPIGQCRVRQAEVPCGCAVWASIVHAMHTGAFMFTCSFINSIVYLTILTAIKRVCSKFRRKQLVRLVDDPCLDCVGFCWPRPAATNCP